MLSGCAPQLRKPSTYEQINNEAKRGVEAQLSLLDGQTFITKNLHVEEDSVRWDDPNADEKQSVSTLMVSDIIFFKRNRAARDGLGYGAVLGAISGLVIGYAQGDEPEERFFFNTKEEKAMGLGLLGIPMGAIVGSFINSAVFASDVKFVMNQSSEESAESSESLNVKKLSDRMEKKPKKE